MAFSMTDDEIRTKIRNGTPIKIIAELNGVTDQTIYNWMKKNGISRPGAWEKKTITEVNEVKSMKKICEDLNFSIEVDQITFATVDSTINSIGTRIMNLKQELEGLERQRASWEKIFDIIKVKGAK